MADDMRETLLGKVGAAYNGTSADWLGGLQKTAVITAQAGCGVYSLPARGKETLMLSMAGMTAVGQ